MRIITVIRKPLSEGNVAKNCVKHGTGALNIDAGRVPTEDDVSNHGRKPTENGWDPRMSGGQQAGQTEGQKLGRWPANLIHDGSADVVEKFPQTSSGKMLPTHTTAGVDGRGTFGADAKDGFTTMETYGDSGSAARFFKQVGGKS